MTSDCDRLHYGKIAIDCLITTGTRTVYKISNFRKAPLHQRRKKPAKRSCVLVEAYIPRENFVVLAQDANTRRRRKSCWRCMPFLSTETTGRELKGKATGKTDKSDVKSEESVIFNKWFTELMPSKLRLTKRVPFKCNVICSSSQALCDTLPSH